MAITFPYERDRAHQAVLWLLYRHGGNLTILKLVKLIFFADRLHLWKHGRPLTGGRYMAMWLGPVASNLLDDLNHPGVLVDLFDSDPRRTRPRNPFPFVREGNSIRAVAPLNERCLSRSDMEVLEEIERQYGQLDSPVLSDMTRRLKAYTKNWPTGAAEGVHDVPYEDFFADLAPGDPQLKMLDVIRKQSKARDSLMK